MNEGERRGQPPLNVQRTLWEAEEALTGVHVDDDLSPAQQRALQNLELMLQALPERKDLEPVDLRHVIDFVARAREGEPLHYVLGDYWNAVMDTFESYPALPNTTRFKAHVQTLVAHNEYIQELQALFASRDEEAVAQITVPDLEVLSPAKIWSWLFWGWIVVGAALWLLSGTISDALGLEGTPLRLDSLLLVIDLSLVALLSLPFLLAKGGQRLERQKRAVNRWLQEGYGMHLTEQQVTKLATLRRMPSIFRRSALSAFSEQALIDGVSKDGCLVLALDQAGWPLLMRYDLAKKEYEIVPRLGAPVSLKQQERTLRSRMYPKRFEGIGYGEEFSLTITVDPDRVPILIGKMQAKVQPASGRVYVNTSDAGFGDGVSIVCAVHIDEETYDEINNTERKRQNFVGEFLLERFGQKITAISFGDYAVDAAEDLTFPLPESDEVLISIFDDGSNNPSELFINLLSAARP